MTDLRLTASSITDEQLDGLYQRIDVLEHVARGNLRHVQAIVPELDKAEDAIERARALHAKYADSEHCQHDGELWPCPTLVALDTTKE